MEWDSIISMATGVVAVLTSASALFKVRNENKKIKSEVDTLDASVFKTFTDEIQEHYKGELERASKERDEMKRASDEYKKQTDEKIKQLEDTISKMEKRDTSVWIAITDAFKCEFLKKNGACPVIDRIKDSGVSLDADYDKILGNTKE